ncbi:EamA family transporter [bacterium 3DAC]|nr:EamA family transporter [bacterium 3DAC]
MTARAKGLLYMAFTVVLWGVSFVATKVLVGTVPPFTAGFLRFVLAVAILYALVRIPIQYRGKDKYYAMLAGFFGVTMYFVFENTGLKFTTATNGSLIVSSTPVWYLVVRDLIDRKPSALIRYIGTIMAFIGVAIIVFNGRFVLKLNPLGDTLMFGAAFAWIFYTVFVEKLSGYDELPLTRDISLWGLIFFIPFTLYELMRTPVEFSKWFTPSAWIALIYLGVFCSALGYLMWNKAIALAGGKTVTNGLYFIPLVTAIAEFFILGNSPNIYTIVGGILTVLGTYIAEKDVGGENND